MVGEAGGAAVGFGVGEVDFLVGDVEVAADDDGFFFCEFGEVVAEFGVPMFIAIGEAGEAVLGVRDVGVDEDEFFEFGGHGAAFLGVEVVTWELEFDADGLDFGEDGGAGVAFFIGVVEVAVGELG